MAAQAYAHTAAYDATITNYLTSHLPVEGEGSEEGSSAEAGQGFPDLLTLSFTKVQDLRYGENPHQKAAFYREPAASSGLASAKKLNGKELSFNNIYDLNAAYNLIQEFSDQNTPAAAIIKHTTHAAQRLQTLLRKRSKMPAKATQSPLSAAYWQ